MNKHLKALFLAVFSLTIGAVQAQRINLAEGDLKVLANEKEINLEFDYSNMRVGKMSEEEYVKKKQTDYNKKEAGKGDNWVKAWQDDRQTRFEPMFIQNFNTFSGMTGGPLASAKYTIIVHTTFTEPGFNIVAYRKNAEINLEALVVETANKSKVLAKITIDKSPGGAWFDNDFDNGQRIMEAYKVAGMSLGGFVKSRSH